ncbi:MAG: hypothetical protein WDN08_16480 [Rhizomicrobium sp.]
MENKTIFGMPRPLMDDAISVADTPFALSDALMQRASVYAALGDRDSAQRDLRKAQQVAAIPGFAYQRAEIAGAFIFVDLKLKNCGPINTEIKNFLKLTSSADIEPGRQHDLLAYIADILQTMRTCDWDHSLIKI